MSHTQNHSIFAHSFAGVGDGYLKVENGVPGVGNPTASVSVSETSLTLLASGWAASGAAWEQTLLCANSGAGTVALAQATTDAQYDACAAACIRIASWTATSITFRAVGPAPTLDLPIVYWELGSD